MKSNDRLLLVDDEQDSRTVVSDVAAQLGYQVGTADSGADMLAHLRAVDPTVVLLELKQQAASNIALLRNLAANDCRAHIIVSGDQDDGLLATAAEAGEAMSLDIFGALARPISVPSLTSVLRSAMAASGDNTPLVDADRLRQAIETREIDVHYQPKVDIRTRRTLRLSGFEALARWTLPDGAAVSPNIFIPLAEQMDLIGPLTDLIVDEVLQQQRRWHSIGVDLPVAVNFSRSQLVDLDLPDRLVDRLDRFGVDHRLFIAEVTEHVAVADVSAVIKVLTRLRQRRIGVALDDFGSGYSSLVELYRLPISELKLDRSLIADLERSEDARKVVQALVTLARQLRIPVCAEGVESAATVDILRRIGCRQAQGFFFAAPMPARTVTASLRSGWLADTVRLPEIRSRKQR